MTKAIRNREQMVLSGQNRNIKIGTFEYVSGRKYNVARLQKKSPKSSKS